MANWWVLYRKMRRGEYMRRGCLSTINKLHPTNGTLSEEVDNPTDDSYEQQNDYCSNDKPNK